MAFVPPHPSRRSLAVAWGVYIASAAAVATVVHLGWTHPAFGVLCVAVVAGMLGLRLKRRRQLQSLLMSGDVKAVLAVWAPAVDASEYPQTFGPLLRATALAAYGMTARARQVLALARPGQAWDEAVEHRLFLDALLNAVDGDPLRALESARAMDDLPLPASLWTRARVITLRTATGALARAFAQQTEPTDASWLRIARKQNPLLSVPLRLAEAVANIQRGNEKRARTLLQPLPEWPKNSVFRALTRELASRVEELDHRRLQA